MISAIFRTYLILFFILLVSCTQGRHDHKFLVLDVIDGDTVIIDHPRVERLRYLGINAPENLTENSPGDPFSIESTIFNDRLVGGKKIRIEFDKERYDPYGRLLGYVFIDDLFVNEEIVRQGLARSLFIGPNRKYEKLILEAQKEAQAAGRGIWSDPKNFKSPSENKEFLISPKNARSYVDQRVVLTGKVSGLKKKNKKVTVLRLDDSINLVFFNDSLKNFDHFGIVPEIFYTGKPVEVSGRVKMYRGEPQIVVSHPISIRVLH